MEDIQVGEYVRTDNGIIGKYVIKQNINFIETNNGYIGFNIEEDIVKHSKNLIDLIEVGDYVNGSVAIDYTEDDNGKYINVLGILEIDDDYAYPIELSRLNIKSIVTKEQFNSVKYEVED